jgi:hypothetical protein
VLAPRIIITLCSALPLAVSAQSRFLQTPEEVRKATEGIVASAAAGNFVGALKELRPLSVIPPAEFDVFEAQVNSQQANILRQFGSTEGYEFVREDKQGSRLLRFQYLVYHEKSAMRWNFVAYKSAKGWVLSHFAFDANAVSFFSGGS